MSGFGASRWLAGAALLLAACTPADQDLVARETARATVVPILEERFPGVPVAPVADCVIDNATAGEIVTLASAAVTGVTPGTVRVVNDVLRRPETITCVANAGVNLLLTGAV